MTRTAGAPIGCQRPSRFWGLGCPKIYHEAEDTLIASEKPWPEGRWPGLFFALCLGSNFEGRSLFPSPQPSA
ncbi:hypothetical protein [Thiolapillus sp.]|uniref:hypothetical protein n=1 Tax=Thiolapillus sp. TaxID=2017437 RepID=UPI003AF42132